MTLDDYTSHEEIRAVLGVSEDELSDGLLDLDLYYQHLRIELLAINGALLTDYAIVNAIAEVDRDETEANFHGLVRIFSAYAVAYLLIPSMPMFAIKQETDGKAAFTRFSQDPYKETAAMIAAAYARFRSALLLAYGAYSGDVPVTVLRPYLVVASPDSDPVTGT